MPCEHVATHVIAGRLFACPQAVWWNLFTMTTLKTAFEKAGTLPADRQERLAGWVSDLVEQERSALSLPDDQRAELSRRLADPNPVFASDEQVAALFSNCLIPGFDGAIFSHEWREALWARFYMEAPQRQRQSVEQYKIVKRA